MSSGVALHSRLVISALTITLLPEPVAPAISRWGIFDRSTAWARPATSRPSANVSRDPDAGKSTSSRIRRRATTLNSRLGISIPTAALPGIGASIRMLRAASAIERSSESASIRLSLMCGAGWTSYWVTTGPALRPMIRASMSKLASFSMIRSSFQAWTASWFGGRGQRLAGIEQVVRRQAPGLCLVRLRGVGAVEITITTAHVGPSRSPKLENADTILVHGCRRAA